MTVWFDMDGTIADFYAVDNWLDKILNEDVSPYEEAAPLFDAYEMNNLINALRHNGYDIGIISYGPHNCSMTMLMRTETAKREWLEKYFPYATKVHITTNAVKKSEFYEEGDILVDDESKNILDWIDEGGEAVETFKKLYYFVK